MGRIQTNIGLITGMPIGNTVDQLMELAARPRKLIEDRNKTLTAEQTSLTELTALLASVQYVVRTLGQEAPYTARSTTTSNPAVLAASVTGTPSLGAWQLTPLRLVRTQQWLSSGFRGRSEPIGAGQISFRFGATVRRGTPLEYLNGGDGFVRGKIRITDRSGASAEIDLSTARSIDDVLEAINANSTVQVTASAHGDAIRLTDHTGMEVTNLRVQEVGGGRTAASLGLAGIDVAAATADGSDVVYLFAGLSLDALNDGNGVAIDRVMDDIQYTLRDGTTGTIDLSPILPNSSQVDEDVTLGDVIERFNAAAPDKLKLEIAPGGDRLVVTDLTAGGETFQLTSAHDSSALKSLGLDVAAVGETITGRRILSGTGDVLLSSLNGGNGLGTLGALDLTDRGGAWASVDLATAETLGEVIERINAAGVGISAQVNRAGNGIELVDTTGQTGNLVVASGDATGTAEKLSLAIDAAVASVNSGELHLQVVSKSTLLADFNGGAGVAAGSFSIVDSTGARATITLTSSDRTVGDLIRKINQTALAVRAEINATGDGIALRDTGEGSGTLAVLEGSSTTAADLHLLRDAVTTEEQGVTTQTIDGSTTYTVAWDDQASLDDVVGLIDDLEAEVSASVLFDGSVLPYRLSISSQRPGKAGRMMVDASQAGFALDELVRADDALLLLGSDDPASGILVSGRSNTFADVIEGIRVEIKQTSSQPVTVTVAQSDTDLVAGVKTMVANYNKFRERLAELTAYDAATGEGSVLTGDATALRLDTDLAYLLSGRFGSGTIRSLGQIGITFNEDGSLDLDEAKLQAAFAEAPEAVRQFFTAAETGFAAKLDAALEQACGAGGSLLATRLEVLNDRISDNEARIEAMNKRLDAQRQRLLLDFYRMEIAIGKLQNALNAIASIQVLQPLYSTRDQR